MALRNKTAVGNRVDERFKVIPNGVKTDCKPEISGPAHSEAEEETDKARREPSHPVLAGIVEVKRAKSQSRTQAYKAHTLGKRTPQKNRPREMPRPRPLQSKKQPSNYATPARRNRILDRAG